MLYECLVEAASILSLRTNNIRKTNVNMLISKKGDILHQLSFMHRYIFQLIAYTGALASQPSQNPSDFQA